MSNLSPVQEEQAARIFRDVIYGKPSTNDNWDATRKNWTRVFREFCQKLEAAKIQITQAPW